MMYWRSLERVTIQTLVSRSQFNVLTIPDVLAGPLGLLGMGTAGGQPDGDMDPVWESCIFTPLCLPPPPPFFPTDPDTSWEFGMASKDGRDSAFPWPCREAGTDSDLLLSLEKVVSQAPGFLFRALSFGVTSLLHFPSRPLLSFIAPPTLPSLPRPPQAPCAFKFCLWKPGLRLDPTSIFSTWGYVSPRVPSLEELIYSSHLLKWLITLQSMILCSPAEEFQPLWGGLGRPARPQASPECSHIEK